MVKIKTDDPATKFPPESVNNYDAIKGIKESIKPIAEKITAKFNEIRREIDTPFTQDDGSGSFNSSVLYDTDPHKAYERNLEHRDVKKELESNQKIDNESIQKLGEKLCKEEDEFNLK